MENELQQLEVKLKEELSSIKEKYNQLIKNETKEVKENTNL